MPITQTEVEYFLHSKNGCSLLPKRRAVRLLWAAMPHPPLEIQRANTSWEPGSAKRRFNMFQVLFCWLLEVLRPEYTHNIRNLFRDRSAVDSPRSQYSSITSAHMPCMICLIAATTLCSELTQRAATASGFNSARKNSLSATEISKRA